MPDTTPSPSSGDPFALFRAMLDEAAATGMENPNAMVVSSSGDDGALSSRVVLLKGFDERGLVFYTNLDSRKGLEIAARPRVALNFYWRETGKQVSIRGTAALVDPGEADAYFATRPRQSQIGAWASRQSRTLENRRTLLAAVAKYEARFLGKPVPRPPHWSGFRVDPDTFEFWVHRPFRLHDRTLFERIPDGWSARKLYP